MHEAYLLRPKQRCYKENTRHLKPDIVAIRHVFRNLVSQKSVDELQYKMSRVVRKPDFCICENKAADQLRGNRDADQRLCFRYIASTVQFLYFLYTKFQASSHLLWLYSSVCVGTGWKPRRPVCFAEPIMLTCPFVMNPNFTKKKKLGFIGVDIIFIKT